MSPKSPGEILRANQPPKPGPGCYMNACVAYLDILGFKALVASAGHDHLVPRRAIDAIRECRPRALLPAHFHSFSDSVALIVPFDVNDEKAARTRLRWTVRWLVDAQCAVIGKGLLLQGGISQGEVFSLEEERIVYGPAFNEAYELTSKNAFFARVAVADAVATCEWARWSSRRQMPSVARLRDRVWFIDYLQAPSPLVVMPGQPPGDEQLDRYVELLKDHRSALLEYANHASEPKELARSAWGVWYHNMHIRRALWPKDVWPWPEYQRERKRLKSLLIAETELLKYLLPAHP